MRTYIYHEKNGNATLVLSADRINEARARLNRTVANPDGWRLDETQKED